MTAASNGGPAGAVRPDGRVVVVGGGLATARACAALRRKGLTGEIEVLAAETHRPYDRPPLSKDVLAGKRDSTELPFDTAKLDVTFRAGCTATGVDIRQRVVHTDRGDVAYDGLVIATGGTPVRLPGDGEQLTLRTIDDALQLRRELVPGRRIVLVGASWIGAEVATAARDHGCEVVCLELDTAPLAGTLGQEVADRMLPWWEGIDLRCGTAVREITPEGVALTDGSTVVGDVVVTGIGIRPAVGWLDGSGLGVDRGVLTDDRCRTNVPGVVAIGDVAQRWSTRAGCHVLVEHWDDAGTSATTAASALLEADTAPFDPVPYFWSDQFGHKIQYVGAHSPEDHVEVRLDSDGGLDVAIWTTPDGALSAWLGVDRPRDVIRARTGVGQAAAEIALT